MAVHGYLKEVLSDDERVLGIAHKHWLVLVGKIIGALVFIAVVLVAVAAVQMFLPTLPFVSFGYGLALLAVPVLIWQWIVWSNHAYVLTSWRIIQVEGVFNKQVIDSSLEKVNDVKTVQSLLGRMFGYGDIEILTASEYGVNVLRMLPHPLDFKVAMLEAKEALEVRHGGGG